VALVTLCKPLLFPGVHLLFALGVALWGLSRRSYDLVFALSAASVVGILVHCATSPVVSLRYVYWCMLANYLVGWQLAIRWRRGLMAASPNARAGRSRAA
jgi:hypothetical protein